MPLRLALRPDGQRLAWTSGLLTGKPSHTRWERGSVSVADVSSGELRVNLPAGADSFADVAFSPDGSRIAATRAKVPLLIVDADSGATVLRPDNLKQSGRRVLFAKDARVFVQCEDGILEFDGQGQSRTVLSFTPGEMEHVFLGADGAKLAIAAANGAIRVFDTGNWNLSQLLVGHMQHVSLAAFTPDNQRLVTQSMDGTTKVWDLTRGREPPTVGRGEFAPSEWAPCVVFDRDGERIYVATDQAQVHVFDLRTRSKIKSWSAPCGIRWLALSADGSKLAGAGDSGSGHIVLWETGSGRETVWRRAHAGCVTCVAFNADGTRLASASDDGTAKVWDVATGRVKTEIRGHEGQVTWAAFAPCGTELTTTGADGTVRFWNIESGAALRVTRAYAAPIACAAFSPDGSLLATGNSTRDHADAGTEIKIWNSRTGQLVRTLTGHRHSIWNLAFSPDGLRLASTGEDWTVKIWDPEHGTLLITLRGHSDDVRCAAFSPDGRRLVSSGDGPFLRLWDATPIAEK
jgi:WD40 repeat protein